MFQKSIIRHCFSTYLKIMKSCWSIFGFGLLFLYFMIKVPFRIIFVQLTMALDHLLYPEFRKVKVESPLFIIAHPRSASSFFHSLLGEESKFVTFSNWEVRNPAIIMKQLMKQLPKLGMLISIGLLDFRTTPWRLLHELREKRKHAHIKGGLKTIAANSTRIAPEEEILFTNILDTQYIAVETPMGMNHPKIGFPELTFHDQHAHEAASMRFFKGCLKRQIYFQKRKQIIAKMNFSIFRIKNILKSFPDARFVFIIRSPFNTIPSHLSAQREALDMTFGLENIPQKHLDRFYQSRYQYNVLFYQELVNVIHGNKIPKDQFMAVRYEEIQNDLLGVVEKVQKFGNLDFNPELEEKIQRLSEKQSAYKAPHKNLPLEAFGLSEEKIQEDFVSYFKCFGNPAT